MLRLLIATNNAGKLKELRSLLKIPLLELVSPAEIGLILDVPETGSTYLENAEMKARAFADASGLLTLADDSGLEVDALDGQPGLYSARFSLKPGASDFDRRQRLLDLLQDKPQPWTAKFRCVISLIGPHSYRQYREGTCEGEIIAVERGQNGFGYDPIFQLPGIGKTMSELSMAEKNKLSHRARAALAVVPLLKEYLANR